MPLDRKLLISFLEQNFSFLRDFGYVFHQPKVIESDSYGWDVGWSHPTRANFEVFEDNCIFLAISPPPFYKGMYPIENFLDYLCPSESNSENGKLRQLDHCARNNEEIEKLFSMWVDLLKKYCTPIFANDSFDWKNFDRFTQKKLVYWLAENPKKMREMHQDYFVAKQNDEDGYERLNGQIILGHTQYHFASEGEGTPLVLLHGFTGSCESWRHVIPSLAKKHSVIAVDLPGHGQTIAPDDVSAYTMPVIAAQVAQLIERVVGEPAHVLGYSMGGRLALYLALAHPAWVSALTLESASPGLETETERAARVASDEALAQRIEREGIEKFVDEWEKLPLFASQAGLPAHTRAELRAQRLRNHPRELALSLRGMGTGTQPSLWEKLGGIYRSDRSPTPDPSRREGRITLIVGGLDTKFVAINQRMQALMPNARLNVVAGAGHTAHLEKPGEWLECV